jgi:predicted RNA-binding Zn-ribbon protein involved in translation (DUF1610 family)
VARETATARRCPADGTTLQPLKGRSATWRCPHCGTTFADLTAIGRWRRPWHRHVSPIFFLLLVVAGLMLGFVAFFLLPEIAHAVGG